jgi:hypothetical protein
MLSGGARQIAGRVGRTLFNPYLGRYNTPIKLGVGTATLSPMLYSLTNAARQTKQEVDEWLQRIPDTPSLPAPAREMRQWASDMTQRPAQWAWGALTGRTSNTQAAADSAVAKFAKNKLQSGLGWNNTWQDWLRAPTSPGVAAARATLVPPVGPTTLTRDLFSLSAPVRK